MADTLLLRLTIVPESDGSLLESYAAHPLLADWVAGWPELEAYPGNYSPLWFMLEPSPSASFLMPIIFDMLEPPPEGAPEGPLADALYLQATMFPGFDPLSSFYHHVIASGPDAPSYFASLPTWEFSAIPRIDRPTVREIRIYAVGSAGPAGPFWTELIGTTETL